MRPYLVLALLCGCGAKPVESELHNGVSVPVTIDRSGEFQHFYFSCMQSQPCALDLDVRLSDPALQARLESAVVAAPKGTVIKTVHVLLYSAEHSLTYQFDLGVMTDLATGQVRASTTISLAGQPSNARYDVSLSFPEDTAKSDTALSLPDSLNLQLRAAWH
jgi:hypothetical protein